MACCLLVIYLCGRVYDQLLRLAFRLGLATPPPNWRGRTLAESLGRPRRRLVAAQIPAPKSNPLQPGVELRR